MQAQAQQAKQVHQAQQAYLEQMNQLFSQLIQAKHDSINCEHQSLEPALARNSEQNTSTLGTAKADALSHLS